METELIPVGNGLYQEVRVADGTPVGEPFDPLTQFVGLSGPGPSGTTTTIGADGKAITPNSAPENMLAAAPDVETAPQGASSTSADPTDWTTRDTSRTSQSGGGGYDGGPSYGGGGYAGAFGGSSGFDDDPFANVPNYQTGQRHPAAGGAPLVPGGMFAAQDDVPAYDNRQQVYVPGGAAAGPFETRSAPTPSGGMTGNFGAFGHGGGSSDGGGGGSNMGANSAIGQAMAGKVRGMASKIQGGGSGATSTTDPTKQYRRQGRRMDRAYDRYNEELADPDPMRVTGWSKAQGYKPGTVNMFLQHPEGLLGDVFPGFNANQFTDSLTRLPMTDIAMTAFGTRGKGLLSKTPVTNVPGILRRQGVKAPKPEYKRSLDASKVANKVAEMYGEIGTEGGNRFDTEALLQNLATAKKTSALRQGLEQQFRFDPGGAADSIGSYLRSAITAGMGNTAQANALARTADRRLIEMGGDIGRMKPKRASKAINKVAQSFLD